MDMPNDAQNVINAYVTNKPNKNEMEKFKKSQTMIIKHQNLVQRYHNIVIKRNYTLDDLQDKNQGNIKNVSEEDIICGTSKLRKSLDQLKPVKLPIVDGIDKSIMYNWNFNILAHFKNHVDPFCSISYVMLNEFFTQTKIESIIAANFLRLVENIYNNTSYHNKMHGLMVAQKMVCLANFVNIFDKMNVLDRAAFVISGLCHDIAHPGRNNAFFINNMDRVSILYNDLSVLENFHASCTFKILEMPETNIFQNLSKKVIILDKSYIY